MRVCGPLVDVLGALSAYGEQINLVKTNLAGPSYASLALRAGAQGNPQEHGVGTT